MSLVQLAAKVAQGSIPWGSAPRLGVWLGIVHNFTTLRKLAVTLSFTEDKFRVSQRFFRLLINIAWIEVIDATEKGYPQKEQAVNSAISHEACHLQGQRAQGRKRG